MSKFILIDVAGQTGSVLGTVQGMFADLKAAVDFWYRLKEDEAEAGRREHRDEVDGFTVWSTDHKWSAFTAGDPVGFFDPRLTPLETPQVTTALRLRRIGAEEYRRRFAKEISIEHRRAVKNAAITAREKKLQRGLKRAN